MTAAMWGLLASLGMFFVILVVTYRKGGNAARIEQEADNAKILEKQRDVDVPGSVTDATSRLRKLRPF